MAVTTWEHVPGSRASFHALTIVYEIFQVVSVSKRRFHCLLVESVLVHQDHDCSFQEGLAVIPGGLIFDLGTSGEPGDKCLQGTVILHVVSAIL